MFIGDSFWGVSMSASQQSLSAAERQIVALSSVLDIVLSSNGPTDLCRHIVHAGFADGLVRGCSLYFLDGKSFIKPIASYGQLATSESVLSAWDESTLSECVREKSVRIGPIVIDGKRLSVLAVPFIANRVPRGLAALVIDNPAFEVEFPSELSELIAKLGAFYLEHLDFGQVNNGHTLSLVGPEDLTTRQLTILSHIETGLVNLEIAKILMLSESTIRQETVKIYRALGVGNRQEAVRKAKTLGLLPKRLVAGDIE